jgi:tetratricopeptide (TPR) repeat protein
MPIRKVCFSMAVLLLVSGALYAQEIKGHAKCVSQKASAVDPLCAVESLMEKGDMAGAEKILSEIVCKMPADWKPAKETKDEITVFCWDQDEFISYSKFFAPDLKNKKIVWTGPSYSKAYFKLAYIAVELKNFENALRYLDKALALEPDHPGLLCEKAYVLSRQKHYQEAYDLYMKAVDIRAWASAIQRARSLRGAGTVLIDLGRLDEAEKVFKRSLEVEPGNKRAQGELSHIGKLRRK